MDMVGKGVWLFRTWFALSAWRGVELRINLGFMEDTGFLENDAIVSYLEYEEPEYNQKKGFTADDFTDNLVGYQTQATQARSFGWETSGYGEIPFAALLVSHEKTRICMGTVVTVNEVVTPCGCVRSMGFRDYQVNDFEVNSVKDKYFYYIHDIGLRADVVANRVEYVPDHVGSGVYPHVARVIADKCFEIWNTNIKVVQEGGGFGFDYTKIYAQLFYPAIVELSGPLEFDAPCPWPPFEIDYTTESNFTIGAVRYQYFYNPDGDEDPPSGIISSYKFVPHEDHDLSMDNNGRGLIKTEYRLVNLRVELCSQRLCNASDAFQKMNNFLFYSHKLNDMLCWCDMPWLGDERIYQNLRNDEVPVYLKSVHGGIIGAPVIHNGDWSGWIVEHVTRNISKRALRPTWSRGVDDETIKFLEEKIPYLKTAFRPKINDVNRLSFAIHDLKEFVPDADLKKEDLDLEAWAQIGNARFIGLKNRRRQSYSKTASITATSVLGLLGAPILVHSVHQLISS